jgi:RNA polymerase sigma-70 factor, ECF subfamily
MNLTASQDLERTASDEELMIGASRGDLGAFEQLVLRYQAVAWNTAYRFLGNSAEAEDIVQEAFLRIWTSARRYQPTALFRTYLYRVVTRICLDYSAKKRPLYSSRLPELVDHRPSPFRALTNAEREKAIRVALDQLPPNQRMVLLLKYFDGLGYADIAEILAITVKAVERSLARARQTLQQDLSHLLE